MVNKDFDKLVLNRASLPADPEKFFEGMGHFRELMMMYNSAIREVTTKLTILNDELSLGNRKNPIQFIKSRVKKPLSIVNKLEKLEKEISVDSIMNCLNDVAGIRVICSFIDDVYKISDYIKNPKANGYRSYHMIIEIPVFFSDSKRWIRVEIQIRTVAMDFWASLEHELKYKKDLEDSKDIEDELKKCAKVIAETDYKMLSIRNQIEGKK